MRMRPKRYDNVSSFSIPVLTPFWSFFSRLLDFVSDDTVFREFYCYNSYYYFTGASILVGGFDRCSLDNPLASLLAFVEVLGMLLLYLIRWFIEVVVS